MTWQIEKSHTVNSVNVFLNLRRRYLLPMCFKNADYQHFDFRALFGRFPSSHIDLVTWRPCWVIDFFFSKNVSLTIKKILILAWSVSLVLIIWLSFVSTNPRTKSLWLLINYLNTMNKSHIRQYLSQRW